MDKSQNKNTELKKARHKREHTYDSFYIKILKPSKTNLYS